jgi:hypothetical protein
MLLVVSDFLPVMQGLFITLRLYVQWMTGRRPQTHTPATRRPHGT